MNIVYTFDDGYTPITAVSLLSLLKSNSAADLHINIVDCGISEKSKAIIDSVAAAFNRSVFYRPAIDLMKRIPLTLDSKYWSTVCYVRLFFAEMFPELDRIMHIDCDTIVRAPLTEVYDIDLKQNVCAACYDCVSASKRKSGMPKNRPYLSNGFLIFDLSKIREKSLEEQFVDHIVKHKGILPHLDQDVLSEVVGEETHILPPKYNLMSITAAYGAKSKAFFDHDEPYYTEETLEEAASNPVVIHYVGNRFLNRPWQRPCYHPYDSEWLRCYQEVVAINPNAEMNLESNYSRMRKLAAAVWNIGYKNPLIRKMELAFDVQYYRKKGE